MADFKWDEFPEEKAGEAGKFDWGSFPEEKKTNVPIKDTGFGSALHGAEQGATLGFSDEIRGAVGAAKDVAFDERYKLNDLVARYDVNRDQARAMLEKSRRDNPTSYLAGEIGGAGATSLVPGVGLARGAGALAALGQGAAYGAVSGLGNSQADLTKGDVAGAARDVGKGALTGGAVGGLVTPLGNAAIRGSKAITNPANIRALAENQPLLEKAAKYGAGAAGAALGATTTGGLGAGAGALLGTAISKAATESGAKVASAALKRVATAVENSPAFASKFGPALEAAAQKGGGSLAVTHELLSKKFPEYQRLLEESQQGQ